MRNTLLGMFLGIFLDLYIAIAVPIIFASPAVEAVYLIGMLPVILFIIPLCLNVIAEIIYLIQQKTWFDAEPLPKWDDKNKTVVAYKQAFRFFSALKKLTTGEAISDTQPDSSIIEIHEEDNANENNNNDSDRRLADPAAMSASRWSELSAPLLTS